MLHNWGYEKPIPYAEVTLRGPVVLKVVVNLLAVFLLYYTIGEVHAEEPVVIRGAYQSKPVTPLVFKGDLRDIPRARAWRLGDPVFEIPRRVHPLRGATPKESPKAIEEGESTKDPILQKDSPIEATARGFSSPDLNIEGQGFTGVFPPDPVGDVGPNHYIQAVNGPTGTVFRIYDKSGNLLAGPSTLDSLWTAGGPCRSGFGDPIVLYDRLANRWLMSEFTTSGNHLCVYVSRTPDPVDGGWFLYDFTTPDFPDYPKYAVWPDAYYVSTNESRPTVYALDRKRMLNGQPATFQRFTAPILRAFSFQALTPADLDGAVPPPEGSPGYFMRHRDDEVHNPVNIDPDHDLLEIWEFRVDFANPADSTFTGPINIEVEEFDSDLCGLTSFSCFPQPDTSTALDPLREVIMWRLQYRNFGTHETLVGNLVTDVDGTDHGGIRWFELRRIDGGPWILFQEGTYAPDAANRWMGSISMDKDGNIAMGYSVSSTEVFPSIRYVGRLESDPLGTMPQGEFTLVEGTGSQTSSTRWGDYSSINVDPTDDCTFWYTGEYTTGGVWRTRIGSFRFPTCTTPDNLCGGLPADITGTPGDDLIEGTPGFDVINGLGGNDIIRGLGGDDLICGGDGDDILKGNGGADSIFGGSGSDRLNGGNGNDTLMGGGGNDTLRGNEDSDTLDGGTDTDRCNGGTGKDTATNCETVINVP
jgi:hypothetical protein